MWKFWKHFWLKIEIMQKKSQFELHLSYYKREGHAFSIAQVLYISTFPIFSVNLANTLNQSQFISANIKNWYLVYISVVLIIHGRTDFPTLYSFNYNVIWEHRGFIFSWSYTTEEKISLRYFWSDFILAMSIQCLNKQWKVEKFSQLPLLLAF